ncbi:MAG: hypothetical protein JWM11_8140, partial [Planctomycetaceae bacterium]|nr:hypothetical protein [Planctomycetaceae bacterium]
WSALWNYSAKNGKTDLTTIGLNEPGKVTDHDQLRQELKKLNHSGTEPVWLILIGHGTFDGKLARFNLRGPDVSLPELSEWLRPVQRPLAIVNCASSSGPFLTELSGPDRIVLTSTKSGHEYNFSRFGDYLSSAISDPQADLDKDEQTSLLEAFLMASARVREFYESEGRLMTEHALLDDNGDRFGTPADWFQGVRAIKSAKNGAAIDGLRANQLHLIHSQSEQELPAKLRVRRDQLEQELAQMRQKKSELPEEEYLKQIEPLLIELAQLYESQKP